MDIEIAASQKGKVAELNALRWLISWFEASGDMADKYKTQKATQKILSPLFKKVPYVPVEKTLYRIIPNDEEHSVGDIVTLSNKIVLSTTYGKGKSFWTNLSEEVGLDGLGAIVELKKNSYEQLFSGEWAFKRLIPYYNKSKSEDDVQITGLVRVLSGYSYLSQKEVVVAFPKPVKLPVKVVLRIENWRTQ
jgi:hypothetical protein